LRALQVDDAALWLDHFQFGPHGFLSGPGFDLRRLPRAEFQFLLQQADICASDAKRGLYLRPVPSWAPAAISALRVRCGIRHDKAGKYFMRQRYAHRLAQQAASQSVKELDMQLIMALVD
jgi:hypothetical protein